ncbi:hypothetical protein F5144DRAFT_644463, partial [Chaetomium tenue]
MIIGIHEKVSKEVYNRLSHTFAPQSVDRRIRAHETESEAKWFGVNRGEGNHLYFGDTTRLTSIINDSWTADNPDQYPCIASFVGQTGINCAGAGKSTITRTLLDLQRAVSGRGDDEFIVPIPGRPGDPNPTTGDVHLYPDPSTQWGSTPLLFADCEGLDAGDKTPVALSNTATGVDRVRAFRGRAKRKITWVSGSKQLRRDEVVRQLFPKILYTISDVVVFVLRASRTLEKVVADHLIPWAARSMYSSLNQAAQPHVVIIINDVDFTLPKEEWDHKTSTKKYLESLGTSFHNYRELTSIVQGLPPTVAAGIRTHADLLKHYYSSVTFRSMNNNNNIPQKTYLMRMDAQLRALYGVIKDRCSQSHRRKEESRALLKAERLERVLAAAFDHFSQGNEKPFNFLQESLWHSPLPGGLQDNFLRFFRAFQRSVKGTSTEAQHDAVQLFKQMASILVSQIFLDTEREEIPGAYDDLLLDYYGRPLRQAFDACCDSSLHCAFRRDGGGARCHNVKSNHGDKGHQDADGKSLGKGEFEFQAGFEPKSFYKKWEKEIVKELKALNSAQRKDEEHRQDSEDASHGREARAAEVHRERLASFLASADTAEFQDHHVCLCCLRHNMPEYPMRCGKVLCAACMKTFRRSTPVQAVSDYHLPRTTLCPFHSKGEPDCLLQDDEKPRGAGVRILCLDGQDLPPPLNLFCVLFLEAIQKELGKDLRIQWFFDLVVGTSTGGITALNLFVKDRPLDHCIRDFKRLCGRAFSPRELKGVPILGKLAMMNHGSVFKTRPFESILQSPDALGENGLLFGGPGNPRQRGRARVAVTTTDQTSKQRPTVLANYNRPREAGETGEKAATSTPYDFFREAMPSGEMKIWEAARATSAAFPYFKPFLKDELKREFVDGGFYHNCPVKIAMSEKRLIWGDVRREDPDILLSLGTGKGHPTQDNSVFRPSLARIGRRGIIGKTWELTAGLLENIFAGQYTWNEFLREATEPHRKPEVPEFTSRYIRLNVDIPGAVPKLYMSDKIDDLEGWVRVAGVPKAKEIAHRLIASCFYLRLISADPVNRNSQDLVTMKVRKGMIECRFGGDKARVKALGGFLRRFMNAESGFSPSFLVQTDFDASRGAATQRDQGEIKVFTAEVMTSMGNGIFPPL